LSNGLRLPLWVGESSCRAAGPDVTSSFGGLRGDLQCLLIMGGVSGQGTSPMLSLVVDHLEVCG
jgi:hypothetical protein